jgi:diphthamide biosynthesis protein 3
LFSLDYALGSEMSVYEEVEIEDMMYNDKDYSYTYQCPCGDIFRITLEELYDGEDIAKCPSCTLRIMVIYDLEDLPPLPTVDMVANDYSDDDEEDEDTTQQVDNSDAKVLDQISTITVSG